MTFLGFYSLKSAHEKGEFQRLAAQIKRLQRIALPGRGSRNQSEATLEAQLKASHQAVEGDRLVQVVELPVLNAGDIGAGRQCVKPAGEHITGRDADVARAALPAET